jgi:hypothetical protein
VATFLFGSASPFVLSTEFSFPPPDLSLTLQIGSPFAVPLYGSPMLETI